MPLIPDGTVTRLKVRIRAGNAGPDGAFTASQDRRSKAQYLLLSFVAVAPANCAGTRFLDRFGMCGKDGQRTGYYAEQGRSHVARMARSAGIRLAKPRDLDGIEVVGVVGQRQRSFRDGDSGLENYVKVILIPGDNDYQESAP
jgi:hypothetical protein